MVEVRNCLVTWYCVNLVRTCQHCLTCGVTVRKLHPDKQFKVTDARGRSKCLLIVHEFKPADECLLLILYDADG